MVDGEYVIIEHDIASTPDLHVHQSSITGVHFEPATMFTAGIITIAVDGAPLIVPTGTSVGSDPYTVLFKRNANDKFVGVNTWFNQLVSENAR